jgi:hypothetical protein
MTVEFKDGLTIDFSMPETVSDSIIVRQCMSGSEAKPIGRIYQDFSLDSEGTVTYNTINNNGEEICPPTTDWIAVENSFAQYAKELAIKERDAVWIKLAEREEEIKNIRNNKNQKEITKTI